MRWLRIRKVGLFQNSDYCLDPQGPFQNDNNPEVEIRHLITQTTLDFISSLSRSKIFLVFASQTRLEGEVFDFYVDKVHLFPAKQRKRGASKMHFCSTIIIIIIYLFIFYDPSSILTITKRLFQSSFKTHRAPYIKCTFNALHDQIKTNL